ncbi:MAG: sulfatase-like hydrolase/transferase, partial [Stappiaceae bacterium]
QAEAKVREMRVFQNLGQSDVNKKRGPGEVIRPGWPGYTHYGIDEDPYGDAEVVDKAVDYIRSRHDGNEDAPPWCLYTGTLGPHDPYTPPQRFLDLYNLDDIELPVSFEDHMDDKPGLYSRTRDRFDQLTIDEHKDALRHYLAFCSYEDELFGRLLTALEETGQADNTYILFLSDHGDYAAEHGLWGKGLPAFQSAYRIPLVIGGPGVSPDRFGHECNIPTSLVDLGPTILELCSVASSQSYSGTSLKSWLSGIDGDEDHPDIFFQSNGNEAYGIQRAVVSNGWKLVYNMFDHDELYNLNSDPDELVNLLAPPVGLRLVGRGPLDTIPDNLKGIVETLYQRLWSFCIDHDDENINEYIVTALAPFGPGIVGKPE